ncbi:YkvA family protein [Haloarcula amylovorans]|uniref:YkvA family protein n=1 Tax=Haloarcula amylovorans TaxID=2562280 RepID=UPI00107681EE|nr:YkvA family protein [Halomicroarcula amylolytica]
MAFDSWKNRAKELETEVYALYLVFGDSRTPLAAKVVIALIIASAVSPIDPIPDFIPGIGYLDEIVVLPVGVTIALWLIPDELMDECRAQTDEEIDVGRARWIMAGLVLLTWPVLGMLVIRTTTNWI